nr:PREDICTED: ribosome-binding protein 1 [Paralichthys olivaceus]
MDIYDPQTLGIMVFGGFMVISAVGIALVSTFSMKETSYEEALAKQRRELGKIQSVRSDKKKKDKVSEKKSRGKKKEDKPNGKIPEHEKAEEATDAEEVIEPVVAPVVAAAPEPVPEPVPAVEVKPAAAAAPADPEPTPATEPIPAAEPSPAPSPKEKKKKKVAKVEPASTQVAAPAPVSAPAPVKSSAAPPSTQAPVSAPTKAAPAAKTASAPAKSAPAPVKAAAAPAKSSPALSKTAPVLEAVTKEVPVMAVPPVGSQQAPAVEAKAQEPKKKSSKKKSEPVAAVDSTDAPLYLPYKALVSTISSMVFSEGEAHRLIEILSEKVGIIQDTWHMATQKGDPVAVLKKQLEEREKQLAAEQEDASAAKNRLRELTKDLSAEKSKVASVETRLSSQLSKREQEMIALQARMQASYQDHVAQTQMLNAKVLSLQDQLDKGPNAQLARLQQENSILRDALNQATSQAESKQNAELAKLRQECAKLTKDLGEKTESLVADEHIRKGLEAKVSAAEKQLSLQQAGHAESEQALQRRLEEVCEELRTTQSKNGSLQATLDKAQQESNTISDFQERTERLEVDIRERSAQVEALTAQLEETQAEKSQLVQQVASINSLLEASQNKKEDEDNQVNAAELEQLKLSLQEKDDQLSVLHEELKQLQTKEEAGENTKADLEQRSEDASLITSLQEELRSLKEEMEQMKNSAQSDGSAELTQLQNSLSEKDVLVTSLEEQLRDVREQMTTDADIVAQLTALQSETKESLQTLFPQIPVETEQSNWLQEFTQKAQEALTQQSQKVDSSTELPALLGKLKEAEESHSSLQAECEQYRTVLAETEGMLKHLQKSVEEEELVWKSKMADSEEQLRVALEKVNKLEAEDQSVDQLKEQMMLLEAQLEKQSDNQATSEEMEQVHEKIKSPDNNGTGVADINIFVVFFMWNFTIDSAKGHQSSSQMKHIKSILLSNFLLLSPQERLEKEKKLSKDLGQAATKLQQLLKATQEQLTKERDTVKTLQEHLEGKGDYVELKEGTSV